MKKKSHGLYRFLLPGIIILLLAQLAPEAHAQDVFIFVGKKEEQKKQSRWSLGEWMATKQKISLMDQWLAIHSSNPFFEGVLGGDTGLYQIDPSSTKIRVTDGHLSLFFSIFGLEAKYEDSRKNYNARSLGLALRLMGNAEQGTHLNLQAGLRHLNEAQVYDNPYLGGQLSIYLWHFFGIEGLYRFFMIKAAKDDPTTKLKGRRYEGTAFIDIRYFRVYGTWFNEDMETEAAGSSVKRKFHGLLTGIKLFF